MRKAIEMTSTGEMDRVLEILEFLQNVHLELSKFPHIQSRDFDQKMNTLVQSIQKVEQACFKRTIRKKEFPEETFVPMDRLLGFEEENNQDWRSKRNRSVTEADDDSNQAYF